MSEDSTTPNNVTTAEPADAETTAEVQAYREQFDAAPQEGGNRRIAEPSDQVGVDLPEIVFGWIAILAWLVLLTCGLVVNTKPHRDILAGTHQWPKQKAAAELSAKEAKVKAEAEKKKADAEATTRDQELLAMLAALTKSLDRESVQPQATVATTPPTVKGDASTAGQSAATAPLAASPPDLNGAGTAIDKSPKPPNSPSPSTVAVVAPTLKSEGSGWDIMKAWIVVLAAYTFPNLALLSCIAAIVGGFCRQMRSHDVTPPANRASTYAGRLAIVAAAYTEAAMRGFVVYLTLIGGLFLLGTAAFSENLQAQDMQAQYIRLAGTLSLIAFITGYDVRVFKRAIDRVISWLDRDGRDQSTSA